MDEKNPTIAAAYAAHEQQRGLERIRLGCVIAMILLPAGALVDFVVYPNDVTKLFVMRCVCALAMLPFLGWGNTAVGARHYKVLGVLLAMIPAFCMVWIIHEQTKAVSPYYAGLNLVLLAIGLVLQWNMVQSLWAVALMLGMYVLATMPNEGSYGKDVPVFINNLWFLVLTGLIVVVGNTIQDGMRRTDFELRYKLTESRKELERSNDKLATSNQQLESSNQHLRELDELKGRFFANISACLRHRARC